MKTRHLTCACCGAGTRGAQWWNRDTGFGVCPSCYAQEVARCGEAYAIQCYGRPGVHHSLPERSEAPAQQAIQILITAHNPKGTP